MAAVSHARYHPPAPPTGIAPPTLMWEAYDDKRESVSPAFMQPWIAAYRDHQKQRHHRSRLGWQQPKVAGAPPPSPKRCDRHQHHPQHAHHHPRPHQHQHQHQHHHHLRQPSCTHPNHDVKNRSSNNDSSASPPNTAPASSPSPSPHRFLVLNELPRMPSAANISPSVSTMSPPSTASSSSAPPSSPFLRLPVEIRLRIYALLVLPRHRIDLEPNHQRLSSSTSDCFDYKTNRFWSGDPPAIGHSDRPTLLIRTIDPERYHERYPPSHDHARSVYSVHASRFRSRCMQTTYQCVNNPRIERNLAILRVNQQLHAEAAELLYSSYTFDFDTHVEAIVPFFADLTPFARSCVQSVRLAKRAIAYDKEYDRFEWSNALRYLTSVAASDLSLRRLELAVVAGRPGPTGWDRIAAYSAADFDRLRSLDGMEWLQYLLDFRGLRELDIRAVVEHCPPVTSSAAMANYVRFSASVEAGFSDYLRTRLLAAPVAVAA